MEGLSQQEHQSKGFLRYEVANPQMMMGCAVKLIDRDDMDKKVEMLV